ncbi:hypothetical protein [Clostridium cylindrosporum]|uniref:Uncharacterized protein n=1 Tax=Clostridium cylindrosporum DSM 605 TaxID=1121307 RepID=A0A0J8DFD6_CLOCY|nr:hypothetical protein [Clostridium cylindrosporum]KMT22964.1 hypothetical protein CLCY_7c00110 [Clostridium cylindrosporum DSM 605]
MIVDIIALSLIFTCALECIYDIVLMFKDEARFKSFASAVRMGIIISICLAVLGSV